MKKLLFLLFVVPMFLILSLSALSWYRSLSYPTVLENISAKKVDFEFQAIKRCSHVLVIEVSDQLLKELGVFREKHQDIELPITMDIALKDKDEKILLNKKNISFSLHYTGLMRNGKDYYGFEISLGILKKGDYFISTSPHFFYR